MDDTILYRAEIPADGHWFEQVRCQAACPVHTDARGYVQAIGRGDYEEAYLIARAPNPLASICGRICGAPCEAACRRGEIDSPVRIRALKRFVAERFGSEAGPQRAAAITGWLRRHLGGAPAGESRGAEDEILDLNTRGRFRGAEGQRIAVVGSGPAGLAAAHDLALMGFKPVIYEMEPVAAGMLAVGVPEYRLPRDLVRAEVEVIRAMGVEIRCGVTVGKDITLAELRREAAAVVLAVGAKKSRRLPIPGADAERVLGGVELLRDVALGRPVDLGRRVVVIGGGNVAYDIGRTVVRKIQVDAAKVAAGRASVGETHICCLESLAEIPADQVEIVEGAEEGIELHTGWGPREVLLDEEGAVAGVRFVHCTRVFDENRRFAPLFDESVEMTLACDTVLLAIGQSFDLSFLDAGRDGVELLANGAPKHDPETLETSAEGLYVAGDLAHGTKLLIHAVASGKQVARSIYARLTGEEISPETVEVHVALPDFAREYDFEARRRIRLPVLTARERVRSQSAQVELPLAEARARWEAGRCLNCSVNTIFDGERCILCGGCVDVCPSSCLKIVDLAELAGTVDVEALSERLGASPAGGDETEAAAILKNESTCIRCGLCAARCPADAITMEHFWMKHCPPRGIKGGRHCLARSAEPAEERAA